MIHSWLALVVLIASGCSYNFNLSHLSFNVNACHPFHQVLIGFALTNLAARWY